jgi:glycosyltransferase involved in cell wall biosynthesis
MKILQLCYKPPFPAVDGGCISMHTLTKGLINNGHQVKVLTFYSFKHPCDIKNLPKDYVEQTEFETIFADLKLRPLDALLTFLKNESYHVKRFINEEMTKRLEALLQEESFDVVQLESIFLAPYIQTIRRFSKAKLVLRAPNIEHLIWQRTAKNTKNPIKKLYLKQLASSLKAYELEVVNLFDGVYPLTKIDADYFKANGCKVPTRAVGVGMEPIEVKPIPKTEQNTLFHIGSMDWMPNQQAIQWFLDNVWDSIHSKLPNISLYLAGRNMPQWLLELNKESIIVLGEVRNSAEFILSKEIMIVPLLSGSGIRIKILEAMSLRKCIIATSQAAEGIQYEDGKNIVIANTEEEFEKAIYKCITDKEFSQQIAQNAEKLIQERYNIEAIARELVEYYEELDSSSKH